MTTLYAQLDDGRQLNATICRYAGPNAILYVTEDGGDGMTCILYPDEGMDPCGPWEGGGLPERLSPRDWEQLECEYRAGLAADGG